MPNDDFSQKEILTQLIMEVRGLREILSEHKELIIQQSAANKSRDHEIVQMGLNIKEMKVEMRTMRLDFDERHDKTEARLRNTQDNLKFFKFRVSLIIGTVASIGAFLLNLAASFIKSQF